jgi:jmjN domain
MSTSSLSSLGSPPPEAVTVQPDHFYGHSGPASPDTDKGYLDPTDDPFATRGIPVFKPNMQDFSDFEGYMNKVECWGMRSGIVKIIPPPEW